MKQTQKRMLIKYRHHQEKNFHSVILEQYRIVKCTDNVINLLQKMLKQMFVDAMGLQDSVRGQNLSYDVYQSRPFVQVINNGQYHWLALSTYGCKEREIYVFIQV